MNLCQSYNQQKMTEIKQIYRYYNLADFIIKVKLLLALKTLIDSNFIYINTIKWVEQANIK